MKRPALLAVLTFVVLLAVTLLIVVQQSMIIREDEEQELTSELASIKERFTAVLNENISAANTLALIYKQNGTIEKFDTIAQELLKDRKFLDIIYLTDKFVITHVYPLVGSEVILGKNIMDDTFRLAEILNALKEGHVKYTGPYMLYDNRGMAIAGRVPIFINDEFRGLSIVITRLSTIQRFLEEVAVKDSKFICQLSKVNPVTHKVEYFFEDSSTLKGRKVKSAFIPEGQWHLHVAYGPGYKRPHFLFTIIALGLLLNVSVSLYVHSRIVQRRKLESIVAQKTHDLGERVKELSTIYHLNNIFRDEKQNEEEIFTKVVNVLPAGWQYVEFCNAKISFGGKDYTTAGYAPSVHRQSEDFTLQDGRTGAIEIVYSPGVPDTPGGPFLKEERDLLNSIARSLEICLNKLDQQKALAFSEERFRSSFEYAAIGMAILSLKGEWLRVNKSLCDMLGYSREELLKLTFQEITPADDLKSDMEFVQQSLDGKVDFYHTDKRFIHRNGQVVWVNLTVSLVRGANEKPLFFISQIVDITERKQIARELELALSLTKATIESTVEGILVVTTSGKISDYNNQFLKLWQIPALLTTENEGATIWAYVRTLLMQPEDFEVKREFLKAHPEKEDNDVLVFLDGRVFEWHSKPQKTGTEIVGRVWSFRDVTQQKHFEAEIKDLNADLEKRVKERTLEVNKLNEALQVNVQNLETANKDLESFSYSVSHDLRAPLRAINGFAGMLESRMADKDEQTMKFLKVITDNARKMNQLIEDLLQFSRMGRKELETEQVDMNAVLAEVLADINIHEKNENTELIVGDMLPVHGDRALLKQVFINLLSNAIKYSSKKEKPHIEVGSYVKEKENIFFVKDNGAGFDMKYYDKLFKVFQRMHSAEEFEGVGVGLAIVSRIITRHGGRVWAKAEENVGAEFYFSLPV